MTALENVSRINGQVTVPYYEAILETGWTNTVQSVSGSS
jgi:hypothetical protein